MKKKILICSMVVLLFFSIMTGLKILNVLNNIKALSVKYDITNEKAVSYYPHFVLIVPDKSSYEWNLIKRGALDASQKQKAVLETIELESIDLEEQKKEIEIAIASKVDGIILDPQNSDECMSLINRANEKGIAVALINGNIYGGKHLTVISNDYIKEGFESGRLLEKAIGGAGTVIVLSGDRKDPDFERQQERIEGLKAYLRNIPDINVKIASLDEVSVKEDRQNKIELYIGDMPIEAVFAVNQDITTRMAQIISGQNGKQLPVLIGVGERYNILNYIRNQIIASTFIQDSYGIGEASVIQLMRSRDDEKVKEIYFLEPLVINKENVDSVIR